MQDRDVVRGSIVAGRARMSLGYTRHMRGVMLEVPEELLAERRRTGAYRRDEVWAGVLHMVPPAASSHQRLSGRVFLVLSRIAARRGFEAMYESGLFDPPEGVKNYRVPDLMIVDPRNVSRRGIEGIAELVIEILSPNDESRDKLPFFARVGVREVWLIDPNTNVVEMFQSRDGKPVKIEPPLRSHLGLDLETIDGKLVIRDGDFVDEI